ncbi:MAG: hypothetical protein ABIQ32_07000 [Sphingomicrobium sp.]
MLVLVLAAALTALVPGQLAAHDAAKTDDIAAANERLRQACGYNTVEALKPLAEGPREAALACFVRTTSQESAKLLPREIEPGVVVTSAEVFEQTLLVYSLHVSPEQARALAVDQGKFGKVFADRSCRDPLLVRLIDAGGAVVYKFQNEKGANLSIQAITECRSPQ